MRYLDDALESFMTFLVSSSFWQISPDADVFPKEHFAVILQPVQNLLDILLEEAQRESLVQLDLFRMPFRFQRPMLGEDRVNHRQDMVGTIRIVFGRSVRL